MRLLIIGGSDAGISAGLAARERDPSAEVTLLVADRYPNFSICGIPYHVSGDVPYWRSLAHRSSTDLLKAGLNLHLEHRATHPTGPCREVFSVVRLDSRASPQAAQIDVKIIHGQWSITATPGHLGS